MKNISSKNNNESKSELDKFQLHFEYDVDTKEVRRKIREQTAR